MKKYYSTLAIVAGLLVFNSCSNNDEVEPNNNNNIGKVAMTFGISLPDVSETRAAVADLANDNLQIYWKNGDKISVFTNKATGGDEFSFDNDGWLDHKYNGKFSGYSYENAGNYWGLYPAQSDAKLENGILHFNIPDAQTAVLNTFDPQAGVQIGKAASWDGDTNPTLALKNACAYFAVTVQEGCESVVVQAQANNGETDFYIAGDVSLNANDDVTTGGVNITNFENCTKSITLSGGDIKKGGTFLIPFIPSSKCPKIIATATIWKDGWMCQPTSTFLPYNYDADTNAKFQFVSAGLYNLGTFKAYAITCNESTNGSVKANRPYQTDGQDITLTVTPNTGYELEALTVMNGTTPVTTTPVKDTTNKYTFKMPAGDVIVSATFKVQS